ncbi:hypothetical protein C1645_816102 [Glomus cerebriforme]|uniref:Uncharacterized protein n=1 Tax=Glomus cerebriforme TaxID=658196 RepID=A0A397TCF5_9GLOM|nr:hypothetical protein C1645_816102 [Glomus cerebriforme]
MNISFKRKIPIVIPHILVTPVHINNKTQYEKSPDPIRFNPQDPINNINNCYHEITHVQDVVQQDPVPMQDIQEITSISLITEESTQILTQDVEIPLNSAYTIAIPMDTSSSNNSVTKKKDQKQEKIKN